MNDRPILFSAPMVRALLDGRKTQTRRILKPQPFTASLAPGERYVTDEEFRINAKEGRLSSVRFARGDRLWVRESFWIAEVAGQGIGEPFLVYDEEWTSGPGAKEPKPAELRDGFGMGRWGHRPGIHMPRRASRLTLLVTDVRVQRLQEIDEADAKDEGAQPSIAGHGPDGPIKTHRTGFVHVWNEINGNWLDNPWVVALTFSVEKTNIDAARDGAVAAKRRVANPH